jgi:hypothetical protein
VKAVNQQHMSSGGVQIANAHIVPRRQRRDFIQENPPSSGAEAGAVSVLPDHLTAAGTIAEDNEPLVSEVAQAALDRDGAEFDEFH